MQNQHNKLCAFFLFFLGIFLVILPGATNSLAAGKKITILYGNDIRGELEPCG